MTKISKKFKNRVDHEKMSQKSIGHMGFKGNDRTLQKSERKSQISYILKIVLLNFEHFDENGRKTTNDQLNQKNLAEPLKTF